MKNIELSENRATASIEPGNTWYDVYHGLEPENLAVIGGRVSAIGVGGLTLGGGISFFSSEYGFACDNVASFEVVMASGAIITASPNSHADLYWSLRGGGNNFGIVTKFELETIPQGLMWGGSRLHLEAQFAAVVDAFYNLGINSPKDVAAAQILSFAYAQNTRFASSELEYSKPIANASIFSEYLAIPAIQDGTMIRTLANVTLQINTSNPNGLRETYWVAAFKLDRDFTAFTKDVFFEEVLAIADAAAVMPALTLQVITVPMLRNFAKHGGNALGLSEEDGPLLLSSTNTMWADEADDERVLGTNRRVFI
ncbi:FAD-binding domain-containing protein [Karstenula rhodostoma CBS 690.94]|uniref:FAD-binding domain-containing protein n=1 Tax=Karstenula rhodostoma CBS 690.94 TaxID=1392251 RepID=A0A9P4PSK9_9PLEO|nr:FAD-binding domain-containing protein [Karstenula rhodostoma CBS 690.94]